MPAQRLAHTLISMAIAAMPVMVHATPEAAHPSQPASPVQQPAQTQEEYEKQMTAYRKELLAYQRALVPEEAKLKIESFHRAVGNLDRETIAASLCYPVRIMFRDKQIKVEDRATFQQYFDAVFTPRFILTLGKIDWTPTAIGDKGVTVGTGQIWFDMNGCVVTFNNNSYVM